MAGHPLRPATDHRLGGPLPRQQANRARATPSTSLRTLIPATAVAGILCGLSPPFGGLFPIKGHVAHVILTRAPRENFLYCYRKSLVRLACVKHAASVRPEPGSNSPLMLCDHRARGLGGNIFRAVPGGTVFVQARRQIFIDRPSCHSKKSVSSTA